METIFFLLATALATIDYTEKNAFPSFRMLTIPVPPSLLEDAIDILQI